MGVVILGMHRGGTSALAGVVHLLGFDAGAEHELIGATEANRRGHWEVAALSEFNEQLLRELGGRWAGPPVITDDQLVSLAEGPWGARGRELFERLLPGADWVWKDPRVCLLLPFWRAVLDEPIRIVATTRPPVEIARSLQRRDGFSVAYGLALWERYQRSAIQAVAGLDLHVVTYDDLIERPDDVVDGLAAFLGVDPSAARSEIHAFLDPGERHHREASTLDDEPQATPQQRALLAAGWTGELDDETPNLQLAFDEHHRMGALQDLAEQLRAGLEEVRHEKEGEIAALRAHRADLQRWYDDSHAEVVYTEAELSRIEAGLADVNAGRDAVVKSLEAVIAERNGWKWTVLQYDQRPVAKAKRKVTETLVGETGHH